MPTQLTRPWFEPIFDGLFLEIESQAGTNDSVSSHVWRLLSSARSLQTLARMVISGQSRFRGKHARRARSYCGCRTAEDVPTRSRSREQQDI